MLRNITTPISFFFFFNLCSKGKISTIIFNRYMSTIIYMAKELTIIIKMGEKNNNNQQIHTEYQSVYKNACCVENIC